MWLRGAISVGLLLGLTACADMPDFAKPVAPEESASDTASDTSNSSSKTKGGEGFFAALLSTPRDGDDTAAAAPKEPLNSVGVAGGDIVIAGPKGYCVDPETLIAGRQQAFAIIASCHILSDGATGLAVSPGMVTVSIANRDPRATLPAAADIADALDTELLASATEDGVVYAHLASGGDTLIGNGAPRHWRAATIINKRLLGLALYVPDESSFTAEGGQAFLASAIQEIRAASPGGSKPSGTTAPGTGLLGKLFKR